MSNSDIHYKDIDDKELDDLCEQLWNMPNDKDRARLIGTTSNSYYFYCEQVVALVESQHYGEAKRMTAVNLYKNLRDPENFQTVIDCYQFPEDKEEIKAKLGL
eukprot:TRINITY_DN12506_c0_g1_i1.p1 TRINITY_DN12506_c0_g1~~TRINITY_DN12506_c0_g1_i1.p1  ORF type:complete len:114 (+),score=18.74 TRINITY_DN12506_c0_g1_i1:36-344(+)